MWTNKVDGHPSASKVWKNIAFSAATIVVIRSADHLAWDMLLVYLAVVSGSEIATRIVEKWCPAKKEGE